MLLLRCSAVVGAFSLLLGGAGCSEAGADASSTGSSASSGDSSGSGGARGCDALTTSIAEEVAAGGACSATIRFDYESYAPLGFRILCHAGAQPDEKEAFDTAVADTRIELAESLTEKAPDDDFVFYRAPIDFGGVAIVSARSGLTVFGGLIVWDGSGEVVYPSTFQPAADLGNGCGTKPVDVAGRGFDLTLKAALAPMLVAKALAAANATVLPAAMERAGHLRDAMVLLYPPRVGLFDPKSAEWVVVLNGGG